MAIWSLNNLETMKKYQFLEKVSFVKKWIDGCNNSKTTLTTNTASVVDGKWTFNGKDFEELKVSEVKKLTKFIKTNINQLNQI